MSKWVPILLCLMLASYAAAMEPVSIPKGSWSLKLGQGEGDSDPAYAFLGKVLSLGARVLVPLSQDLDGLEKSGGGLKAEAAFALWRYKGPYYFLDADSRLVEATKIFFPNVMLDRLEEAKKPSWVAIATGIPRIGVLQNVSSISPLSEGLTRWGWPFEKIDFGDVEGNPDAWLSEARFDFISFSSPGWWNSFASPPSGPSRMGQRVAKSLQEFVRQGGSAYFCDLAQWDLEKAWPGSLKLEALGPLKTKLFKSDVPGDSGELTLAPFGVAAKKVLNRQASILFENPKYPYPGGKPRPAVAAYGFGDPQGGKGWVVGQAYHSFDQEDKGGAAARRYLLNLLLFSGSDRVAAWDGKLKAPQPTPSPIERPTVELPSPVPSPSLTSEPTIFHPTATLSSTLAPSLTKTPLPPVPSTTASPRHVFVPTQVHVIPSFTPSRKPSPTRVPTMRRPSPTPFLKKVLIRLTATNTVAPSVVPSPADSPNPKPLPPDSLGCLQSAPEPFSRGGVYLYFCLKQAAWIQLEIYDEHGKAVRMLDKRYFEAGNQQFYFNGKDAEGNELDPGCYFYNLAARYAGGQIQQRYSKMTKE